MSAIPTNSPKRRSKLIPMPPHYWLLGHIPLSASIIGSLPPYAHGVYVGDQIRQRYSYLDSAFYLDNWPLAAPILVVLKPDMMYQLTQSNQIPKDKGIRAFLVPLTGEFDLVTLEGGSWKYWRSIFNPGFSAGHVSSLVPGMIEEIKIFKDLLRKYAKSGKMMFLEDASLNLTIDIIGANIADAESVIASKPQLLNQLTYTIAVIKESLRIYPTVAALRDGQSYFSLIGDNGLRFPTERTIVWGDHYATHHNPAHWPRAEEFLPERWIVTEGHELYPPKNGWRPFERGPRNCFGQEVAMTEIKLMLALTIQDFDFKDAYEEYDAMKGYPKGLNVNGQRAYMMLRGGGHPADHYPCKVSLAKQR
ncbi:hypothetical protein BOTNAR_0471g00110 [Botryotinia narcissicola]|uniref:Cytochrome P450 n=1 Tax=Botryotinia narcissicola TaxID=278944 RepID=A0A4Z1HIU2_9HELO|nr:hypothetical protein BOTNAR_0471g00110 [Botryotinia narcissicola]